MKQIKNFSLTSLLVSASSTFHTSVCSIITTSQTIIILLSFMLDDYLESIARQKAAANRDLRKVNTRAITDADKVRDSLLSRFFKYLDDFLLSKDADEAAAAATINGAVKRFRGMSTYEMTKETGEVENFITTLRDPDMMTVLAKLDMVPLLNKVEAANAAFIAEINKRTDVGLAHRGAVKTADQRKETERLYTQIVQKINALSIISPSADVDECIDSLNLLIDEAVLIIGRMQSGGGGNEKLPPKDTSKPE